MRCLGPDFAHVKNIIIIQHYTILSNSYIIILT